MSADLNQLLSRFAATGVETSFHDRHINPQIMAGLNGKNWSLKDYEARGGYQALASRKIKSLPPLKSPLCAAEAVLVFQPA
jgi:hypothetical protein